LTQTEMLLAAERLYKDRVDGEILRILDPGDESLLSMVNDFEKIRARASSKTQVACFYEQIPCHVKEFLLGKEGKKV
jgi:hypothetical protein